MAYAVFPVPYNKILFLFELATEYVHPASCKYNVQIYPKTEIERNEVSAK